MELQSQPYASDLKWLTLHHQLLTLAQVSARNTEHRRDGGRGLWFRSEHGHFGALIPSRDGESLVLTYDPARWLPTVFNELIEVFKPQKVLLAREAFDRVEASTNQFEVLHEEFARIRRLQTHTNSSHDIGLRRARALDLALVQKWAAFFDEELKSSDASDSSSQEVVQALIKQGSLFIASDLASPLGAPFGMVALTGTYSVSNCPLLTRISMAYVAKEKRGFGLGSKMIDALCAEIALEKNGRPILFSDAKNNDASRFYDRLDFEVCGSIVVLRSAGNGKSVITTGK